MDTGASTTRPARLGSRSTGHSLQSLDPNEAGKTSLLRALCRLDDDSPIESRDRTRLGGIPDSHEVLEAMYLIEPIDRDALPDLRGADDPLRTRWFVLSKYADGSRATQIIPGLRRDRSRRREAERTLRRLTRHPKWPTDHSDDSVLSPDRIVEILEMLASDDETIPDDKLSPVRELIVELSPLRVGDHPRRP